MNDTSRRWYRLGRSIYFRVFGPLLKLMEPPLFKNVSWGDEFPDKRFFVIRRNDSGAGLFSWVFFNFGWINYAINNGMIPVVDMASHLNLYLRRSEVGKVNSWEYFFEQPCGYSLSDIRHAKNVVIRDGNAMPEIGSSKQYVKSLLDDITEWAKWQNLYARRIRYNIEPLSKYHNDILEECLLRKKVIGVLARGTDYVKMKPRGHSIQPTMKQLIDKVDSLLNNGRTDYKVYLVTEDAGIVDAFMTRFQDRLILSKQQTIPYVDSYLVDCDGMRHNVERGFAYLKAVIDLSRCPIMVAGGTCGSACAALMSAPDQERYFFNLGYYS